MGDDEPPKSLVNPTTGLSEKQLGFIENNISKDVWRRRQAKQDRLKVAWTRFQFRLRQTDDVIESVRDVAMATGKEVDWTFVRTSQSALNATIAEIQGAKVKSLDDSLTAVERADAAVEGHYMAALEYLRTADVSGRDIGDEAAIARIKASGRERKVEIMREFDAKLDPVLTALEQETGTASLSLGIRSAFNSEMSPLSRRIEDIPLSGPDASPESAQTEVGTVVGLMAALLTSSNADAGRAQSFGAMVDAVTTNTEKRDFFADQVKRRGILDGEIRRMNEAIAQLYTWDCAGREMVREDGNALKASIPPIFPGFDKLDMDKRIELQNAQEDAIREASGLTFRARRIMGAERELFDSERTRLEAKLISEETEMSQARQGMSKSQRVPVENFLATIRTSLTRLGGYNLDALKPIEVMLNEAEDMVDQAKRVKEINTEIARNLKTAADLSKPLSKPPAPLAEDFAAKREEIGEFAKTFKTLPISDALSGSERLLSEVEGLVSANTALVARRADIAQRIVRREEQLGRFMELYERAQLHAGKAVAEPYKGKFISDLETCRTWNETKTNIDFYSTIDGMIDTLRTDMLAMQDSLNVFVSNPFDKQAAAIGGAAERHRNAMLDLGHRESKGEDVDEAKAQVEAEYKKAVEGWDAYQDLNDEATAIKRDVLEDERLKAEFLERAPEFISEATAEVKNRETVLFQYADEVKPQIDRIKSSYDLVRRDKPGATGKTGLSEISFVEKFLESVRKRGAKTDKEKLADIGRQWNEQVNNLRTGAAKLVSEIKTFEDLQDGMDNGVSTDVNKTLMALINRVASHSFGQAGSDLSGSDDPRVRKAAREMALSEVRRCRAVLMADPLFQKCVLNPFSVPLGSGAANRLDEIERGVLLGV